MMDNKKDFLLFAKDKMNIPTTTMEDKMNYDFKNFVMPYILEERKLNVTSLDVYSRLLLDRIIFFSGEVDQVSCNTMIAQLLYLSSVDDRDINIYINSQGGSVIDGLALIDTMNFVKCDISTTCIGMAASMGAVLLSCGKEGKRFVLPHSRVMIHSVSSGFKGHTPDIKIEMEQTIRCQNDIYNILAKNTKKTFEEIEQLCDRDNWFIGEEAIELGVADKVILDQKLS